MRLVMAILRTAFFVFIVGFTVRYLPSYWRVPNTLEEFYRNCSTSRDILQQASWLAVAWILVEVVVGWVAVRRRAAARPEPAAGPGLAAR